MQFDGYSIMARYAPHLLGFEFYITKVVGGKKFFVTFVDEEGEDPRVDIVEVKPGVDGPRAFIVTVESTHFLHRELNYYGPCKSSGQDMEQVNWLRGMVERQVFDE